MASLEPQRSDRVAGKGGADQAARRARDQDAVGCGQRLQAGGEVRSFADHFVLRRGTCEITDGSPPVPREYLLQPHPR